MNRPTNNTSTLLFVAMLPLVLGLTFIIFNNSINTNENVQINEAQWSVTIEDVELNSGSLGTLIIQLHGETHGERRADELLDLIGQITAELNATDSETSYLLTDLLRDISLEHPDSNVRLEAYEAMMLALENEHAPFIEADIASN